MIADADGARLRAAHDRDRRAGDRSASAATRSRSRPAAAGTPTSFSSAGLDAVRPRPEAGPRRARRDDPLLDADARRSASRSPSSTGRAWRRRTSPARPRCSSQRHPNWSAPQIKSALMSTAGPAWGDTARTTEALRPARGRRADRRRPRRRRRCVFTDPQSLSFHYLNVNTAPHPGRCCHDRGRGRRLRDVAGRARAAVGDAGATIDLPAPITVSPGGDAAADRGRSRLGDARRRRRLRLHRPAPRRRRRAASRTCSRSSGPASSRSLPVKLASLQVGDTRRATSRASVYRWPAAPFGPPPSYTGPPIDENGAEQLYVTELAQPAVNMGVAVDPPEPPAR